MPTEPAPQPPVPQSPRKPLEPPADAPTPEPDTATPKPADEGAISRALLDAGADAMVAYTADKRMHTMVSQAVAQQLQPVLMEIRQVRAAQDRRFDELDRRLNEHDRKLDVLAAQMRLVLGGLGLLVTVLVAVFGFLFTA